MTARTTPYSARTNAIAAEAVLTAAVEEAVGLLRAPGHLAPGLVEWTLYKAASSAELLLARTRDVS